MAYQKQTWVNDVTDVDATHMNHIEDGVEKAYGVTLLAVTDEEPSECSVGDKYFNTTTNKIYDAVDTDTWDDEGYDAESGVFYVVFEEQAIYTYNGITLIGVGSSGAGGESIPIATILAYGGTTAPEGYLLCNGQEVSRTTYAELFALIGTTYGQGDGSTTFGLPNLKGRVLVGLDANDTSFNYLGKTGGSKELQEHNHIMDITTYTQPGGLGYGDRLYNVSANDVVDKTYISTTRNAGTGNSGNLQPYIVVNFIIKATSTTPITANVVNEESQSTTDTYSCDYVNQVAQDLEDAINDKQEKGTLLWTNPDPSSAFSEQTINNINLTDYEKIKIVFSRFTGNIQLTQDFIFDNSDLDCEIIYSDYDSGNVRSWNRSVILKTTSVEFGNCTINGTRTNTGLIPYKIIGYK